MPEFIIDANLPFRISKWQDFLLKQLIHGSPPKVIHIKFGNLLLNDFEKIIIQCWDHVEELIKINSLINIFQYNIETIK